MRLTSWRVGVGCRVLKRRARPLPRLAARERRRAGIAAEAAALMANPDYVAEARELARLMEQLRGPR